MRKVISYSLRLLAKIFSFDEKKFLVRSFRCLPSDVLLGLVDVGAAGDIEPRWKKIEPLLAYHGFEPDSRSSEKLKHASDHNNSRTIHPFALWDTTGPLSVNLCMNPQVSSHFRPNKNFLDKYPKENRFDVLQEISLEARRMDDMDLDHADFIKIDVQGGELAVLKGATATLKKTFGLEIEVEFLEMYRDQPLFGEIVDFLNDLGFEFIDFVNICRWERDSHSEIGQSIFGDALFLKPPEVILDGDFNLNKQTNYLKILLLYRRFDLIKVFLTSLPDQQRQKFKPFEQSIKPIQKNFYRARQMSLLTSRFLRLFFGEYRTHLIY